MTSPATIAAHAGIGANLDATETTALSQLYSEPSAPIAQDWCDLSPTIDRNRDGDDGVAGVRLV